MLETNHVGPWQDIKHLIHYAVTIVATYAQAAKGRKYTLVMDMCMEGDPWLQIL